jgi:hypothetical protein
LAAAYVASTVSLLTESQSGSRTIHWKYRKYIYKMQDDLILRSIRMTNSKSNIK